MLYPKTPAKKRRKKHKASIMPQIEGTCYLCIKLHGDYRKHPALHEHHIFPGKNRQISEANGFKAKLCPDHHEFGLEAVHQNIEILRILQRDCQREFEKTHTREEFMDLIGRNYL